MKRLVSGFLLVGIVWGAAMAGGLASAQDTPDFSGTIQQAQSEINVLYQQFRQENPNKVGNLTAFLDYVATLSANQKDPNRQHAGWNGQDALYTLPSGGMILSHFVPKNGALAGFWVDVNGTQPPNQLRQDKVQLYVGP